MPVSRPGAATARLRVPGTASGVNPRLPRRATRDGGRGSRALHWAFAATVARLCVASYGRDGALRAQAS